MEKSYHNTSITLILNKQYDAVLNELELRKKWQKNYMFLEQEAKFNNRLQNKNREIGHLYALKDSLLTYTQLSKSSSNIDIYSIKSQLN